MKRIRIAQTPKLETPPQAAPHTPDTEPTNQGSALRPEQHRVLSIQRQSGNQSVRRYLHEKSITATNGGTVQRIENLFSGANDGLQDLTPEEIQTAIDKRDGRTLVSILDYRVPSVDQREKIADIFMGQWSDLYNVSMAAQRLWHSFGDDIFTMPPLRARLFKAHIKLGMGIALIPAVQKMQTTLEKDVRAIAKMYTAKNKSYIEDELRQILPGYASPEGDPYAAQRPKQRIEMIQEYARQVKDAEEYKKALQTIPVGYDMSWVSYMAAMPIYNETTFDPQKKPEMTVLPGHPAKPHSWDEINNLYQICESSINTISGKSPAVYRAKVEGRLDDLINNPPAVANQEAASLLLRTLIDISNIQQNLDGIEALDMIPIITQLTNGNVVAPSGTNWVSPFNSAAAEGLVGKHKMDDMLKSLGIALAGAAAFAIAEVATGGLATVALIGGAGASTYQAVDSITKAINMSAVVDTAVSEESRIITQGQASDAMLGAALDTVGFFLDGIGGVASFRKVASFTKAGMGAEAALDSTKAQLKTLDALTPELRISTIRQAINEFGVEEATKLAGLPHPEALLPYVHQDPDLLARIRAFTTSVDEFAPTGKKFAAEIEQELSKFSAGEILDPKLVDALLVNGIDAFGAKEMIKKAGGWKKIRAVLPEKSEAGKQLFKWRDQVYRDLEKYIGESGGRVEHTGTYETFKNDLDISFMGEGASINRQKAFEFLEHRTGFKPAELEENLLIDLFTDPNRSHIYDALSDADRVDVAAHAAGTERDLILNKMLLDAEKEGPESLARVQERFRELGLTPSQNFHILTKEERAKVAMIVDSLHNEFETTTDVVKRRELAKKISDYQAQINLSEGGGYVSGGGVADWVTRRDKLGDLPGGAIKDLLPAQQLSNLVDQFAKLEHAMQALSKAQTVEQAVAALRDIGKYGFRYTLGRPMNVADHAAQADKLADSLLHIKANIEFKSLKKAVDVAGSNTDQIMELIDQADQLFRWVDADSMKAINTLTHDAGLAGRSVNLDDVMSAMDAQLRALQYRQAAKRALEVIGMGLDVAGAKIGYDSGRDAANFSE